MQDEHIYTILIQDHIDDERFNINSPQKISILSIEDSNTLITSHCDQAGLIGLLRQLHQQGFVLINVYRDQYTKQEEIYSDEEK